MSRLISTPFPWLASHLDNFATSTIKRDVWQQKFATFCLDEFVPTDQSRLCDFFPQMSSWWIASGNCSASGTQVVEMVDIPLEGTNSNQVVIDESTTSSVSSVRNAQSTKRIHSRKRLGAVPAPTSAFYAAKADADLEAMPPVGDEELPGGLKKVKVWGTCKGLSLNQITCIMQAKVINEHLRADAVVNSLLTNEMRAIVHTKCLMKASTQKKVTPEVRKAMMTEISISVLLLKKKQFFYCVFLN